MLKNHKKIMIINSIIILLPIILGILLWDRLPEQIPTHWNALGEVDQYSNRAFAVFFLPLFLLAVHWLCLFITKSDQSNQNQNEKVFKLTLCICPVISVLGSAAMYGSALGYSVNMVSLPCLLIGCMFLIIGNYLPKCRHNYTIGIKLPWTLANEANWNATHRYAGKIWTAGSLLMMLGAILPQAYVFPVVLTVLLICVLLPTIYSYRFMKTHG